MNNVILGKTDGTKEETDTGFLFLFAGSAKVAKTDGAIMAVFLKFRLRPEKKVVYGEYDGTEMNVVMATLIC